MQQQQQQPQQKAFLDLVTGKILQVAIIEDDDDKDDDDQEIQHYVHQVVTEEEDEEDFCIVVDLVVIQGQEWWVSKEGDAYLPEHIARIQLDDSFYIYPVGTVVNNAMGEKFVKLF